VEHRNRLFPSIVVRRIYYMEELVIRSTKEKQILDITEEVKGVVRESNVQEGVCHLFIVHTTAP